MNKSKRKIIKVSVAAGSLLVVLPNHWVAPVIKGIVIPAHAQTSFGSDCSGIDTEPVDQAISITVTDTEVRGPIVVARNGNSFASEQTVSLGRCSNDTNELTQVTELSGTINSAQNRIVGTFNVRQYCGTTLVCEQLTDFVLSQTPPVNGDDQGVYQGRVIGTLRCCRDAL